MPNDNWTIDNNPPPNPGAGNALNGLQIQPVLTGTPPVPTGYLLMNGSSLLATATVTLGKIEFKDVSFAARTWDIIPSLPWSGTGPLVGNGSWHIKRPPTPPDSDWDTGDNGEFTAQVGTGIDPEAASSANA
jgi:hypothetical protein